MSFGSRRQAGDAAVTLVMDTDGRAAIRPTGPWTLRGAGTLGPALDALAPAGAVAIDLAAVTALDTVGAYLLLRLARRLRDAGRPVEWAGIRPDFQALVDAVSAAGDGEAAHLGRHRPILDFLAGTGHRTIEIGHTVVELLDFLGLVTMTALGILVRPGRLRFGAVLFHIQQTGVNALPILGLLSFLIGVVLAFQGSSQLQRFGAELFVVNILGLSILREIGVLMTSIIIAGRSGSAFTAQIGTMKVNEEVDAIQTLGLDPIELLVIPRMLALAISLPLLAFYADIMGLLGGAVMCWSMLDISFVQFARQLNSAIGINAVLVGLIKAPVFAATIALVGCHEGLQVTNSAESVGLRTTRSVVQAIFLVIVLDAAFSILFQLLGV